MPTRRHFIAGSAATLGLAALPAAPEALAAPAADRGAAASAGTATPNLVAFLVGGHVRPQAVRGPR
ncbi:hypothetical protein [Streptomyces vinaceus]|uniref:hypothetical protein n=1 Tax=Streptomyces vinaceus TaxID=1960 RepID=UPI0036A4F975